MDHSRKAQVKTILKTLLAGQRPRLEDVIGKLCLSTRTLQRCLLEEVLTLYILLEEAQREMATHYLLQSSLELNETGYLPRNMNFRIPFIRAFRKWEASAPGEWRSETREKPGRIA